MIKRLSHYPVPHDPSAFHHDFERLVLRAYGALPGLRLWRVTIPVGDGPRVFHIGTELYFDSNEKLAAALGSEAGAILERCESLVSTGGTVSHIICVEHEGDAPAALEDPHAH